MFAMLVLYQLLLKCTKCQYGELTVSLLFSAQENTRHTHRASVSCNLNGASSESVQAISGVPSRVFSGSITFFYLYWLCNLSSNLVLDADDILLYMPIVNAMDCAALQADIDKILKVTLNSCAHAHSTIHEYHYSCIAGNGNGVRGSVVFWCSKICEQRQQANYFFMLGKLYDHWRRAWDYKPAWNAVCL